MFFSSSTISTDIVAMLGKGSADGERGSTIARVVQIAGICAKTPCTLQAGVISESEP
jgi:hypothetical protein